MKKSPSQREFEVTQLRANSHFSDEELVERAIGGQNWAREAIYRRYVDLIAGLSTRLLGCSSEGEDLCQDTFVTAFQQLASLREPRALKSWLTQIAVHRAHKIFRKRKLRKKLGFDSGTKAMVEMVNRPISEEFRGALLDLQTILEGASASQRICWWLRYGEGYSLQEVAQVHKVSLATAKRRIFEVQKRAKDLSIPLMCPGEESLR